MNANGRRLQVFDLSFLVRPLGQKGRCQTGTIGPLKGTQKGEHQHSAYFVLFCGKYLILDVMVDLFKCTNLIWT